MLIDASKSKLFGPIMESAMRFFKLGSDATEAELHQKLEEQTVPLDELLEQTRTAATGDLTTINERLTALEGQVTTLTEQNSLKDTTILELQTAQAAAETAHKTELEALKMAHNTQVRTLAGEVSSLRAGKPLEQEVAGDPHEAGKVKDTGDTVLEMKDSDLQRMIAKRKTNAAPPATAAAAGK